MLCSVGRRFRRIPPLVLLPLAGGIVIANPVSMVFQSGGGAHAIDGAEYQAQGSYAYSTGGATKHVLQTSLSMNLALGTFQTSTGGLAPSTGGHPPNTTSTATGSTTTGTTGSTSTATSTTGTTGTLDENVSGTDYYVYATTPTEAPSPVASASVVIDSNGDLQNGLELYSLRRVYLNPYPVVFPDPQHQDGYSQGALLANLAAVGNISSGAMTTVEVAVPWQEVWEAQSPAGPWGLKSRTPTSLLTYVREDFTISKLPAYDAAVDTRKVFGVPNDAGELPGADPNAVAGPVNFTPWKYQGGLFVGNAPWVDNDGSGTSRVQFWPQGVTSGMWPNCYSTFVGFYLGTTTVYNANLTVGLYTPSTSDPNLGSTESTVMWPSRWTSLDPTNNPTPITTYQFTPTSGLSDYYNFHMGVNQPVSTLQYLAFINTQEQSFQQSNTQAWRYFASRWYGASVLNQVFPYTDCAPRLWVVTQANGTPTTWTATNNGQYP